jgi:hypothetical protein
VSFIKFPPLLLLLLLLPTLLAITLRVGTLKLRRMTLEYYNDDGRCKELLESG